jgi:hypothetical protein
MIVIPTLSDGITPDQQRLYDFIVKVARPGDYKKHVLTRTASNVRPIINCLHVVRLFLFASSNGLVDDVLLLVA